MAKVPVFKQERVALLKEAVQKGLIKLLFFDLETSLMEVYTHYIGNKVSIFHNQIKNDKKIITIQWMFEGDKKASYIDWDFKPETGGEDSRAIEAFVTEVMNIPGVISVGQNSKAFDHKVLNDRIRTLKLTPIEDILKVDVLTASRQSFKSASHKLDYRSSLLGFGGKIKMEFEDWVKIQRGDKKSLDKMIKYGLKDVEDLRSIFWAELPYYEVLPAKLTKILSDLKASKQEKLFCSYCRNKKHASRKIVIIKKVPTCMNCGSHDYIDNEGTL